jgi:hypothetical protein
MPVEQQMGFPIKSAIILMLMSFAGGIYMAIHDDGWSPQRAPGSGNICSVDHAEQAHGGDASPCIGAHRLPESAAD